MAYRIRIERNFYGPRTDVSYDTGDGYFQGEPVTYQTRKEAELRVAELDHGTYYLSHNEYERPTYRIVRAR